ncbi:MAG: hypothetical protein KIS96_12260 [Bauldia sp.]|nr:hypothetical protein [Bauldia sp.]
MRKVHLLGAVILLAGVGFAAAPALTFDPGARVAQNDPLHGGGAPAAPAPAPSDAAAPALNDGIYTAEQAERAWEPYFAECAQCHGNTLRGTPGGPRIVGSSFRNKWVGESVGAFSDWVRGNMPAGRGGQLPIQVYADLLALIFQENGYPAGDTEFDPLNEVWAEVTFTDPPPAE